jgi:hypothetical protein
MARPSRRTASPPPPTTPIQHILTITTDLSDLAAIDKMTSMGILHPQIPICQLQTVGQVCGLLPLEVVVDKLLWPEDANSSGKGGSEL